MKKYALLITGCLLILWSCNRNPLDVDISDIETKPLEVERLEQDLFALDSINFDQKSGEISKKYGRVYEYYLMSFLSPRGTADSMYKKAVLNFTGDREVKGAYLGVKKVYTNEKIEALTDELNNCVKRFKYHFPGRKLPRRFVTATTGWNYRFAYYDSALVTGLDMYLGDTSIYYTMLRLPQYQAKKTGQAYLLPDIVRGWLLTEFDNSEAQNTLLYHTIFYGKLFYAVNALLPDVHDSLLIGYSGRQLAYCKTYEKNLWGFFAEKNRLYESNMNTVRELTSEGPFTGAISKECPPYIAMWVGWQIVKSYMKNNEAVTIEQLMNEKDAQKILNKSKYRP